MEVHGNPPGVTLLDISPADLAGSGYTGALALPAAVGHVAVHIHDAVWPDASR
jgi:hypothetical protein